MWCQTENWSNRLSYPGRKLPPALLGAKKKKHKNIITPRKDDVQKKTKQAKQKKVQGTGKEREREDNTRINTNKRRQEKTNKAINIFYFTHV